MKVAANLMWLTPGRVGGSEEYLTRQLSGIDPATFDVELFCESNFAEHHPDLSERFTVCEMPFASNRAARIVLEHTWLPARSRSHDVVHHGGGTVPLMSRHPIVLTIHDLQYLRFPHYFSATRLRYLSAMTPRSVRAASVIAVPSEFVRADVIEAFGAAPERVIVVPHGVPESTIPSESDADVAKARHGVGEGPYVIFPAITHPHKGHAVLVDMLDYLDDDTSVVLIGGRGEAENSLVAAITASTNGGRVHRLGRVSPGDRDALIAGADVLVFPSEFEGFGAPIVEAMALGVPVVCSDAAAVAEVVGDAGIVVEERNGAAWADGVATARRERARLVERGRRRRSVYTVAQSGRAIEAAYRMAAS